MLGHFLTGHEPVADAGQLTPGTPVAAVTAPEALEQTGLVESIRFGVADRDSVIYCAPSPGTPGSPYYQVKRCSTSEFCNGGSLYTYSLQTASDPCETLLRAQSCVGQAYRGLRSYIGDDFVYECATGCSMLDYMRNHPGVGTHLQTPLKVTLGTLIWFATGQDYIGEGKLPLGKVNPELYELTHHGIRIEGQQMIHFAACRTPDGSNQIKCDSVDTFRYMTSEQGYCGEVKYPNVNAETRLRARNLAIYVLTHRSEHGTYNLLTNNCEHFCHYCMEGNKTSPQVKDEAKNALKLALRVLPGLMLPAGIIPRLTLMAVGAALK